MTPAAGFPLAITTRVTSVGDQFDDCGSGGGGAISLNSNDSVLSGGHRIVAPVIRCATAGISSAISVTAPNCIVSAPEISGPHAVGVNVQDLAMNFKLLGGTIADSTDTGVKLSLLSGSPVNADGRVEVSGVTIDSPGDSADGIGMVIANVGNAKISNNTIIFGGNTKWGFRFSGGQVGCVMSDNSVIGTATIGDAYSTGTASFLDDVDWSGNKMGTVSVDTITGVATILDTTSSIVVPIVMIKTPLVTATARSDSGIYISAISATSMTLARVGGSTSGAVDVHYHARLST